MKRQDAAAALRDAGLSPVAREWGKTPGGYLKLDRNGWDVTVYFSGESDQISQILLIGEHLTEAMSSAGRARMEGRFGAPASTRKRQEATWKADGATAIVLTCTTSDAAVSVHEERHRTAPGPVGWGSLTWGMTPVAVEKTLRQAGYSIEAPTWMPNPCELPNAPPDCRVSGSSLRFTNPREQGSVAFQLEVGLVQFTLGTRGGDENLCQNRLRAIEAERGGEAQSTDEVTLAWRSAATKASLTLRHNRPADDWTVFEEYLPPGSR